MKDFFFIFCSYTRQNEMRINQIYKKKTVKGLKIDTSFLSKYLRWLLLLEWHYIIADDVVCIIKIWLKIKIENFEV